MNKTGIRRLLKALHMSRREDPPVPVPKTGTRHSWKRATEEDMIREWDAFMEKVGNEQDQDGDSQSDA